MADYSAALLGAMGAVGEIAANPESCEVGLYHLGNNHLHREIHSRALRAPGVVVIHDAVLHHFYLGTLMAAEYEEEVVYNYGEWARELARELWRDRSRSATDARYFEYPLLRRAVERARAVVVHNPAAGSIARAHGARAVFEIPHLVETPPPLPGYAVERLRRELGADERTLLCGVFGHLRESKRLAGVLRAVAGSRGKIRLLVAGEFASSDLARAMAPHLDRPGVMRRGYLSGPDFWRHAQAVDLAINLRYPGAGESSGIGIRLMGLGKPVIFSAGQETLRFPAGSCVPIDSGPAEEEALAGALTWLAHDRRAAGAIGALAQQHVRLEHAPKKVAGEFWNVLNRCYDETP